MKYKDNNFSKFQDRQSDGRKYYLCMKGDRQLLQEFSVQNRHKPHNSNL